MFHRATKLKDENLKKIRPIKQNLIISLLVLCAFTSIVFAPQTAKAEANTDETLQYLELFSEALERVREDYVTEKTDKELIESAIGGMLRSLDPHSVYLNADRFDDLRADSRGEFGGLGIEVTMDQATGTVKVVSPIDDTPADKAGLKSNDLITHIDGALVQGMSLSEAVEKMRGVIGEAINLTISRAGKNSFEVEIIRDRIQIRSVRARLEGDIGYIRLNQFNGQAETGLVNAVKRLEIEYGSKPLLGYVLDLRNNPGGLLDQAVNIADRFMNQGEIVYTKGRDERDIQRFQAKKGDIINGLPLVVLINGGSASASEIVAGALQDHRRALIMGTNSFGKGSVQTMLPLSYGGAALKLTTQHYYTPSGRSIQAKGIEPDIYVPLAKIELLENPVAVHERDLRGALENPDDEKADENDDATSDTNDEAVADQVKDNQLEQALDVIKALAILQS